MYPADGNNAFSLMAQYSTMPSSMAFLQNQNAYNNILQGYQNQIGQFQTSAQNIGQGMHNLWQGTMNRLQNYGASQKLALDQQLAQANANSTQSAISRGLGNTTVVDSMQRGNQAQYQQSQIGLTDTLSRLYADYNSKLGGEYYGQQREAAQQLAGLQGASLGFQGNLYSQAALQQQRGLQGLQAMAFQQALQGSAPSQTIGQLSNPNDNGMVDSGGVMPDMGDIGQPYGYPIVSPNQSSGPYGFTAAGDNGARYSPGEYYDYASADNSGGY